MFENVVVLVGLRPPDAGVLTAAREIALRGRTRHLFLLHVRERAQLLPGFSRRPIGDRPVELDRHVAALAAALPGVEVVGIHAEGRVAEELARVAERESIDLAILGRLAAEEGRAAWGEHGPRILRTSDQPVLIVPEGAPVAFGRALVGMDFSASAVEAMRVAVDLFDHVEAVSVVDSSDGAPDAETTQEVVADLDRTVHGYYRETVRALFGAAEPPPLRIVADLAPADALLSQAETADAVVVGSRGLTPIAAVFLGSTAERLGGRCSRPILVVRRRGEQRGVFGALLRG